ncbi:HNH endonuclease signature motif containing protein [Salinicola sp. CR57]|uniref:HNH endonuclease n=1 Tax=Salinicola sp. CR57 TaxID=1949086 RepID=UPI000DA1FCA7|nr:HNH endonuclease signature motif containing protein [Salinicola sp. CR57]
MKNLKDFKYEQSFGFADIIRTQIKTGDGPFDTHHFFNNMGDVFLNKALKPNKKTLLHEFIEESIFQQVEAAAKMDFEAFRPELIELIACHQEGSNITTPIQDTNPENYSRDYLMGAFENQALKSLTKEVFNLLFSDRRIMQEFNSAAAEKILKMKKEHYPNYLQKDGMMIRYSRWPGWLRRGLGFRDKMRCVECHADLSQSLTTNSRDAIDHVVPLAKGGINDPTNLQILCNSCNSKKGGVNSSTTGSNDLYWDY